MKRFPNFAAAGRELADELQEYRGANDTLVIAIATGGVMVGAEVAKQIQLPFDLLMIRRLLAPNGAGSAICAVNVAGRLVVDDRLGCQASTDGMDHAIADGLEQLAQREHVLRGGRAPVEVARKNVILVDNGIHTGSTVLAAIRALRRLEVGTIVVAVPVADPNSRAAIERAADRVVCLGWPDKFGHVGMWYQQFVRPAEQEISEVLSNAEFRS